MNYGNLRTHFKALLNRSDCTDALADTFIDQAITRIQRTLRIPVMEKTQTYSISNQTGSIVVPSDMLDIIDLYFDKTVLVRLPLHNMLEAKDAGEAGTPKFFTRENSNLLIYPEPTTGTVTLNYYGEFAAMSSDSDENMLAKIGSDLICYAALGYAADYYLDERTAVFEEKFGTFMRELQEQANAAEQSGTVQVMRPSVTYDDY